MDDSKKGSLEIYSRLKIKNYPGQVKWLRKLKIITVFNKNADDKLLGGLRSVVLDVVHFWTFLFLFLLFVFVVISYIFFLFVRKKRTNEREKKNE